MIIGGSGTLAPPLTISCLADCFSLPPSHVGSSLEANPKWFRGCGYCVGQRQTPEDSAEGHSPTFLQGKSHFSIERAWSLEFAQCQAVKIRLLKDHMKKRLLLLSNLSQRSFSAWQSAPPPMLIVIIFKFPNFWEQVCLLFCHTYQDTNVVLQEPLFFLLLIRKKQFQWLCFSSYLAIKQQNVLLSSACS